MKVLRLTNLALMTRLGVPLDVIIQKRPPESDENIPSRCENTFVSEVVVSILDNRKTIGGLGNLLSTAILTLSEHSLF